MHHDEYKHLMVLARLMMVMFGMLIVFAGVVVLIGLATEVDPTLMNTVSGAILMTFGVGVALFGIFSPEPMF